MGGVSGHPSGCGLGFTFYLSSPVSVCFEEFPLSFTRPVLYPREGDGGRFTGSLDILFHRENPGTVILNKLIFFSEIRTIYTFIHF